MLFILPTLIADNGGKILTSEARVPSRRRLSCAIVVALRLTQRPDPSDALDYYKLVPNRYRDATPRLEGSQCHVRVCVR